MVEKLNGVGNVIESNTNRFCRISSFNNNSYDMTLNNCSNKYFVPNIPLKNKRFHNYIVGKFWIKVWKLLEQFRNF